MLMTTAGDGTPVQNTHPIHLAAVIKKQQQTKTAHSLLFSGLVLLPTFWRKKTTHLYLWFRCCSDTERIWYVILFPHTWTSRVWDRHSVGTCQETSSNTTHQGTLSHSHWSWPIEWISVHELISTLKKKRKKKRRQGMNGRTFSQNPRKRGKSHYHIDLLCLLPPFSDPLEKNVYLCNDQCWAFQPAGWLFMIRKKKKIWTFPFSLTL